VDKKPTNNVGKGNTERKKLKYLCKLCVEDHPTHLCPRLAEAQKLLAQQHPAVLTNPFPHGKNLNQASVNADGGIQGPPSSSSNPMTSNIYMLKGESHIATRGHDYRTPSTVEKGKEAKNLSVPFQIKRTMGETMTRIPKGAFKKASHNPNARATHNYSMVEDLSQTPCAMSALEVLQSCPSQRKALLATLGSTETCNLGTITLDTTDLKPCLPYHVAFHIVVAHPTKSSDGRSFRPGGIIPSFPVQLRGKIMCVEVEVVDVPLDYNLLLGRSLTYAMHAVVATVFRVLLFP
jgi:hypothetical protein